jgi:3-hydroxyisobutyrate dehydrogenase
MADEPRLGLVGLGLMGSAMALRLRARGRPLTVWNLEPERVPPIVAAGAVAADSPAAVAAASDVVLLCVLDTPAVERCVFGDEGIARGAASGALLIDLSTADPAATRAMAARLAREAGMAWVDAPVSGGPPAARDGTLTVMAGGDAAAFARAQPVLADLAANLTHVGAVGAGQIAKVINQAIVGTGYVVMAEALALAEAAGIDAAKLPACLAGGHADSALLQRVYPQMQARAFEPPRGYARQLAKDLVAVRAVAHDLGLALPVVEQAVTQYTAYAHDNPLADSASVSRAYEKEKGKGD